ncbi:MAG: flagellin, partial [Armatimonadota bacterium]
ANEYLGNTDTAMASVNDLVNQASTLALQGANATTDTTTRAALANQVSQLQQSLLTAGNIQGANDKYMFAGQDSKTRPFSAANGVLTFSGDDNPVMIETRPGEKMQVNLANGSQVFTDTYNKLESLRKNLLSGDNSSLQTNISDLKTLSNNIIQFRGDAGTKMQTVNTLSDDNKRRIDDLTKQASDAQDVDLATTLTQYQSAQISYQASLQVISSANKFSLLDFLR